MVDHPLPRWAILLYIPDRAKTVLCLGWIVARDFDQAWAISHRAYCLPTFLKLKRWDEIEEKYKALAEKAGTVPSYMYDED